MPDNTILPETLTAMARRVRGELAQRRAILLDRLARFVRAESPSTDKRSLDRFARLLAGECKRAGADVRILSQSKAGNHVLARFGSPRRWRPILILGHYDTVYPLGTLARTPFRVRAGRAVGPGTFDMKSGLVIAISAIEALNGAGIRLAAPVNCLFTSDEEIGSHHSRHPIEGYARASRAALVLEPAAGLDGKLKTARKGTGQIELIVHGKQAHAGLDPAAGVNAINELALQLERIRAFNDPRTGTTVSAVIVEGGSRANVIPDRARAEFDVRVAHSDLAPPLERRFRDLQPILPGARLEIRSRFSRPPMERTPAVAALFAHTRRLGSVLGMQLEEASVGGASDGNFTAALGLPTLDGLGGVGDGAHSSGEFVFVKSLVERAALLAMLLAFFPKE
jgi:glutamate carboxypeptidase